MIETTNIKYWQCLGACHNEVVTSSPSLQMFCHSGNSPLRNETVYLTVDINNEETHLSFLTDENGEVHFSLDTTSWNSTLVSLKVSISYRQMRIS